MHTRKHTGGPRRRNNTAILILALILLLGLAIGGTVAFLIDTTDDVENTFTPAKVEISIDEDYSNNKKTSIKIENPDGDDKVPCYVRVALVTNWVIAEGENAGQICTNGHSTDVTFTPGDGWTKGGDDPVPVRGKTSNLLGSDEIVLSQAQDGCKMQVEVVASAIQSTLGDTAQAAWAEAVK